MLAVGVTYRCPSNRRLVGHSLTEEIPSSVESGAGPSSIRVGLLGTKRRVGFDIEDVGSDDSGSNPKRGGDPMIGYEAMRTRIANLKKEREKATIGIEGGQGIQALLKVGQTNRAHGGIGGHLFREL